MEIYIITDTHFNHRKLVGYNNRPQEFDDLIWNGLKDLPRGCVLIHLGDICMGKDEEVHKRLASYDFKKILVKGNHDKKSNYWYLQHGWDFVCDQFSDTYFGRKILFSHKPIMWDKKYEINIHGHFHNTDHRRHEPELMAIKNDYQKLLAIEWTDYKPVLLEDFIKLKLGGVSPIRKSSEASN